MIQGFSLNEERFLKGQKSDQEYFKRLLEKINLIKQENPYVRVYLGASKGKEDFYRKFGFITRSEAGLGEEMILKEGDL